VKENPMRAADFVPVPDGPARFIWLLQNDHPNTPVTCGGTRDNAGHLGHLYAELLAYAAEVEADRDMWKAMALKLADAVN
jgi:hypothetical protein